MSEIDFSVLLQVALSIVTCMCFVYVWKANFRMPAQSGDPVTTALHRSLSSVKKRSRGAELNLESMLVASAKQVLSTEIKYELSKSYNSSILYDLKSKYIVLTPASGANGTVKSEEIRVKDNQVIIKKVCKEPVTLPVPKKVLYPPDSVQIGWKNALPVGSGFVNLGNTCYLNSTLQALFHVPAFVNWLLNDTAHSSKCQQLNGMTHSECLICAMCKTLQCSHKCTGSAIKPVQIYSKLKSICKHLVHGHQEDAHEFLRYLMEGMEKSYLSIFNGLKLDTYSKETTPLNQIFGGYIRTEVTCLECEHVSTTFQHFQDLLLDIRQATSVEEAMDSYFGRERLGDGDQAYKCEQCHRRVAATKKFSLERPPKALCIQLKRFGAMGGKNSKHINLKQYLDIGRFRYSKGLQDKNALPLRYKLVAMVTHLGPSANCGHYTAVGMSCHGSYYLFDDSVVRPLSIHNVLNTNAYIILYEQETPQQQLQENPNPSKNISANGHVNGIEIKVITPSNSGNETRTPSPVEKNAQIQSSPVNTSPKVQLQQQSPQVVKSPNPVQTNQTPILGVTKQPVGTPSTGQGSVTPYKTTIMLTKPTQAPQPHLVVIPQTCLSKSEKKVEVKMFDSSSSSSDRDRRGPLVPYLSESSESESEVSTLTSPERPSSPPPKRLSLLQSKSGKLHFSMMDFDSCTRINPPPALRDKPETPKMEVDAHQGSWEVTPALRLRPPSPTNSIGSSSGRWSVTSNNERDRSVDKSPNKVPPPASMNNVGKKWDGSRNSATIDQLLKMSHRGYGNSVNSWNGGRSEVDRDEGQRHNLKRSHSRSYDDDLDRGKVKKQKKYNQYNKNHQRHPNGNRNRFQEFQNRKNSWGSGGRQNFYRQYTYERSRNNRSHGNGYYHGGNQHRWH